jgi:hypothetical protein
MLLSNQVAGTTDLSYVVTRKRMLCKFYSLDIITKAT